ncbi:MlaC/ttg2D family ABC transporter substrate-binding protein [Chiayiivirga flava]|uniref:Phospholipid transport system substrate-binding protein n=1 Tax=Chiayiivirga flava TaxID=659595 RepID=A0A7W8D4U7_9GAMM|nr:ABC transporter substrate-binding protein [Chiayiivirga flava]MBB5207949.1 phospholipid transport system substrate-binding protein [Chiayiivirga flava]
MIQRILLALAAFGTSALALAADPGEIVETRTKAVLTSIVEQRADYKADPAKLTAFVKSQLDGVMDRTYSAQLVLGRHAKSASQQQITAFADALTDSLLRRYATALIDIDPGVDVKILSQTPLRNGELMRVASQIVRKGGAPVPVDYMFRPGKDGGDWKVFDVIIEGVSYVQTYRTQFDEQLRSQSLDQVIAKLESGEIQAGEAQ